MTRGAVVKWAASDGLTTSISEILENLGYEVVNFLFDEKIPNNLDFIFVYGPSNSLVPLSNQLIKLPISTRPDLIFWQLEEFPNPNLPEWMRFSFASLRSEIERLAFYKNHQGDWKTRILFKFIIKKAKRFLYYGDLIWLRKKGLLSLLAVTSDWTGNFFRQRGFDPTVAYMGYTPDYGKNLNLNRDIPVLWIGKYGSRRRRMIINNLRTELSSKGVQVLSIDGEENPYVFGEERTILLNRTKIVLNILREPWDDNSQRYFIAAPNRALIVTESTFPHTPFIPGHHIVEVPLENIASTICYYLEQEELRKEIVDNAYRLVMTDLTMENSIIKINNSYISTR